MENNFKGTNDGWNYSKPTEKFDACTVSESGKIIGYCAKNSEQDQYNELLRANALNLHNMLLTITTKLEDYLQSENLMNDVLVKQMVDKAKETINKSVNFNTNKKNELHTSVNLNVKYVFTSCPSCESTDFSTTYRCNECSCHFDDGL